MRPSPGLPVSIAALLAFGLLAGCGDHGSDSPADGSVAPATNSESQADASIAPTTDAGDGAHDAALNLDAWASDAQGTTGDVGSCFQPCEGERCECSFETVCGSEFDWSKDGQACSVEGQNCYWPPSCSGADCFCQANEQGELVWSCGVRLC